MANKKEIKKRGTSITLDPFIMESAISYAEKENRSLSSLVEHLLAVHLINEKKKEDETPKINLGTI